MYVYSESVFNTLYIEINTNLEKILFGQNKLSKKDLFFLLQAPTHQVLLLTCDSYMS